MGKKSKKSKALKTADTVSGGIVAGYVGSHGAAHILGHTVAGKLALAAGHLVAGPTVVIASAVYLGIRNLCSNED